MTQTNGPHIVMILTTTIYGKASSPEKTKYNSSSYHENAYSVDSQSQQSDLWDTWENSEVDTGAKQVNSKWVRIDTAYSVDSQSQQSDLWDTWENSEVDIGAK